MSAQHSFASSEETSELTSEVNSDVDSSVEERPEGLAGYKKGGYHPVNKGEIYHDRYEIISQAGWGHFSTVWLARNMKPDEAIPNDLVIIKFVKSASQYTDAAMDEIEILKHLEKFSSEDHRVVKIIERFTHFGPNGRHVCLVFKPLGRDLLWLIKRYKYTGVPIKMCKRIFRDILVGLRELRTAKIIHTDIKPENILLTHPRPRVRNESDMCDECQFNKTECCCATLCDLGNACYTTRHFTDDITTRQYKSPEALLVVSDYDTPTDIFSTAALFFELITGDYLFDPKDAPDGKSYSRNEDHFALIIEMFGPMPQELIEKGKLSKKYFNEKGNLKRVHDLESWDLLSVLKDKYKLPRDEAEPLADLLNRMLVLEPSKRENAEQLLQHPWLYSPTTIHNVGECRRLAKSRSMNPSPMVSFKSVEQDLVSQDEVVVSQDEVVVSQDEVEIQEQDNREWTTVSYNRRHKRLN